MLEEIHHLTGWLLDVLSKVELLSRQSITVLSLPIVRCEGRPVLVESTGKQECLPDRKLLLMESAYFLRAPLLHSLQYDEFSNADNLA
jgi:hypothetical protein